MIEQASVAVNRPNGAYDRCNVDSSEVQLGIVETTSMRGPGDLTGRIGGTVFRSFDEAWQHGCTHVLHRGEHALELLRRGDRPGRGVRTNLSTLDTRTGAGNVSRRQPLGRAVGRQSQRLVDATAGFGGDALLLACMGYDVIAIERSPVIAALLADGLDRARAAPGYESLIDRIELRAGDAREILPELGGGIDAVYIDPMFPPKRRQSALAPKRVRTIGELVGADTDAAELVEAARRTARRVVVKRPTHAQPLAENPSHTIRSKLVRYDVYIAASQPGQGHQS